MWVQVEVLLHICMFHALLMKNDSWNAIRLRVYRQLGEKSFTAQRLDRAGPIDDVPGSPAFIPDFLPAYMTEPPDGDTYLSRPFFSEALDSKVVVNDVARFRIEVTALPCVLQSLALFVEVELLVHPATEDGHTSDNSEIASGSLVPVVDTKVFRIANLTFNTGDHYACHLEGDDISSVAHFFIHTAATRFSLSKIQDRTLLLPLSKSHLYWRKMFKSSKNKEVSHWFLKSHHPEDVFNEACIKPRLPRRLYRWLLSCCSSQTDTSTVPSDLRSNRKLLNGFISQILHGTDACDVLFGGTQHHFDADLLLWKLNDALSWMGLNDLEYSLAARMLIYIYVKILAQNAVNIGMFWDKAQSQKGGAHHGDGVPMNQSSVFKDGAILRLKDGKFEMVGDSQEVDHKPLFNSLSTERSHVILCERLNAIAARLGIEKYNDGMISISLPNGMRYIFDDMKAPHLGMDELDAWLSHAMDKILFDISLWLKNKWEASITLLKQMKLTDEHISDYCKGQGALYKMFGAPGMTEKQLVMRLKNLKITDEHHFFFADCFPFLRYSPGPPLQIGDSEPETLKSHLIVLVHGYHGYPLSMRFFRDSISAFTRNTDVLVVRSLLYDPEVPIEDKAKRVAKEIEMHIQMNIDVSKLKRISFVAHSMGGIVVRAALKYLQIHREKFHAFISLTSPHLGTSANTSAVVEAGFKAVAAYRRSGCLKELILADNDTSNERYLYRLSKDDGFQAFKSVKLFGIMQDVIANAYSCLLDLSIAKKGNSIEKEMKQNIEKRLRDAQVERYYVDYKGASNYVRWKSLVAHTDIMSRAILARIFLFLTYDIF